LELKQFFAFCLQDILDSIERHGFEVFEKDDAILFEKALMSLCQFAIGGQRREVIIAMDLDVSD
jgi:hypothetical protein